MRKSILKELMKCPYTYGLLYLGAICFTKEWLTARNRDIHRTYDEVTVISKEKAEHTFRQEQKKIGLENQTINLVLKDAENKEGLRGKTTKNADKYELILYPPYTSTTMRHELSHVRDLVEGKMKIPYNGLNPFPLLSEFRAQNYAIAEAWKTMLHSPEKARALLKDPDKRYEAKMRLLAKEAGVKLEKVLE